MRIYPHHVRADQLKQNGLSIREISEALDVKRRVVSSYLCDVTRFLKQGGNLTSIDYRFEGHKKRWKRKE